MCTCRPTLSLTLSDLQHVAVSNTAIVPATFFASLRVDSTKDYRRASIIFDSTK